MAAMRTTLAAICACTLLATAYLTASLLVLRPPRANYQQWAFVATVIVAQGVLTLMALRAANPIRLRYVTAAGGAALAAVGVSSVYSTMSGPHFEGYALVLGSVMVVQGLRTVATFLRLPAFTMAGLRKGTSRLRQRCLISVLSRLPPSMSGSGRTSSGRRAI